MNNLNKFEIVNNKRLMLPLEATYTLNNADSGFADGSITVKVDLNTNSITDIVPFWADDNEKLKDYNSLFPFRITDSTTVFDIGHCVIIPKGATRLLLYALNYDTGEMTDDYYAISLPKIVYIEENENEVITEFQVVSDVHIGTNSSNDFYINILNKIVDLSPKSLGLFISGDLTQGGKISEYKKHKEIHNSIKNAPNYYMTIGNHEFYDGGQSAQKLIEERFVSFAYLPDGSNPKSQHYDFWLDGYHFVFLGNDGITKDLLSATYKDETMVWLERTLQKDREEKRPVFLFCHYPIQRTVSGSLGEFTKGAFTGLWGDNAEKLKNVLKKFPELLLFTGHQHFILGFPNTMYVRDSELPTIFNTSSASQVASCRDGVKKKGNGSEGYFVYVYKERIILRGYDFAAKNWIPSAYFYVDFKKR